jgi:hypothetical protein
MTNLLEQAFAAAARLSDAEQDLLASRLLAELAAENDFDRAIGSTADRLAGLAQEAIEEHHSGKSEELDPEQL